MYLYTFYFLPFSLLDAVMKEPVLIQHDDDVEVYNRPAASEYYHTQVIVECRYMIFNFTKKRIQRVR